MIKFRSINLNDITFGTNNRSFASLQLLDYNLINDLFKLPKKDMLVYWFTRISVIPTNQGQGEGSLLLKEICNLADEKQFIILLGINSYGRLSTEELRQWYNKYGWNTIQENIMVRFPK